MKFERTKLRSTHVPPKTVDTRLPHIISRGPPELSGAAGYEYMNNNNGTRLTSDLYFLNNILCI